jgi:hypothetical protein
MWIEPFPEPAAEGVAFVRRLPWERSDVTVCIAAICQNNIDPVIVCCTDRRASSRLGKTEHFPKARYLGQNGNWVFLAAGMDSEITALHRLMHANFSEENSQIDETNISETVLRAVTSRKNQKAEEYIGSRFGITYQEFINTGKEKFPPDIFRGHIAAISKLQIPVECIVGGSASDFPILCKMTQEGSVSIRDHFVVCGEGEYLASSVLYHRSQNDSDSL